VFHAGTERKGDRILTEGGRVLNVTAIGKTMEDARRKAYAAVGKIKFEGMVYRSDIGAGL
jgi:phosphoribosylamine--glycine ligase